MTYLLGLISKRYRLWFYENRNGAPWGLMQFIEDNAPPKHMEVELLTREKMNGFLQECFREKPGYVSLTNLEKPTKNEPKPNQS